MAAVRPLVLVYQELAGVSGVAETPTLETLIMGPCFHVQDYASNRDSLEITPYGDAEGSALFPNEGPSPGADIHPIIISDAPGNVPGAQVDHSSVTVYMEDVVVEVVRDDPSATGSFGTDPDKKDLFDIGPGSDLLLEDHVRPGDILVVTHTSGETNRYVIQEVGKQGFDPNSDLNPTEIRTASNHEHAPTNLTWRVERVIPSAVMPSEYVLTDGNSITITNEVSLLLPFEGVDQEFQVLSSRLFVEYTALRKDLAKIQSVNASNIEDILGTVDERNPLAVGAQAALLNTTTDIQVFGVTGDNLNGSLDRTSAYAEAALQIESRDDIYAIIPLTKDKDVVDLLLNHAEKFSSPERARFRTVIASYKDLPTSLSLVSGFEAMISPAESPGDPYLYAGLKDEYGMPLFDAFKDVRPGDHIACLWDIFFTGTVDEVIEDSFIVSSGITVNFTPQDVTGNIYVLRNGGTRVVEFSGAEITGQTTFKVPTNEASTDHIGMVAQLNMPDNSPPTSGTYDDNHLIVDVDVGTGVYTVHAGGDMPSGEFLDITILDTIFSTTDDPTFTLEFPPSLLIGTETSFKTNGVISGDILRVTQFLSGPNDHDGSGELKKEEIDIPIHTVQSENKLVLDPKTYSDLISFLTVRPNLHAFYTTEFEIVRILDREGQKEELIRVVDPQTGYNSKRLILVWPDEVSLTFAQNNKTRTKNRQPGYYLACAIGGMSAGLPPHQGFTFLGVSGFEEVFHSTRYFSEDQLEEISNSGWYLFVQDTSTSTPYSLHQLTTDVSDTRNMEFSVVRVFDYVSRFYKRILESFLGRYNVTPQTLDILRESLNNGTDQLRGETLPRIGAPILNATVNSVSQLEGQRDRVEVYMSLDLPVPLNRIGLRLTA